MRYLLFLILLCSSLFAEEAQVSKALNPYAGAKAEYMNKLKSIDIQKYDALLYLKATKGKQFYDQRFKGTNDVWVDVKITLPNQDEKTFELMNHVINENDYLENNNQSPMGDVSYGAANKFCLKYYNAVLVSPFVFDQARKQKLMTPLDSESSEIIAPYDEEEDENLIHEGDKLLTHDSQIILFSWDKEYYIPVSNHYRSTHTFFRCMRGK